MPSSRKRPGARKGPFVPKSQRDFGTLEDHAARAKPQAVRPTGAARTAQTRRDMARPRISGLAATPSAAQLRHTGRNIAIGAGAAAAAGGAGYLVHRHNQRKNAMSKNLVNPFEEVVVFGKAYPVALPVARATRIRALVPTGRHVGHGNALTVVHNGKAPGGRNALKLERYTTKPKGLRQGPFGKSVATAAKGSVQNGLDMIAAMPKPRGIPSAPKTGQKLKTARTVSALRGSVNSNIPDGARAGRKL